jgi:hypothetical protein
MRTRPWLVIRFSGFSWFHVKGVGRWQLRFSVLCLVCMGHVFVLYVYRFWFEWDRGGAMSEFLSLESSRGKLDTGVGGFELGVYSFSR